MAAFIPSSFSFNGANGCRCTDLGLRTKYPGYLNRVEDVIISACFSVIAKTTRGGLDCKYTQQEGRGLRSG